MNPHDQFRFGERRWLVFASDEEDAQVAEYRDFQEEADFETPDENAHRRKMRLVMERHGIRMPNWVPTALEVKP